MYVVFVMHDYLQSKMSTAAYLEHCFFPRALLSAADAKFAVEFTKKLIEMRMCLVVFIYV